MYKVVEIKINVAFRNIRDHMDSERISEHVFDRMMLRRIIKENIREAVQRGPKKVRKDGSIVVGYRWFRVVYREFIMDGIRKIYPTTVID